MSESLATFPGFASPPQTPENQWLEERFGGEVTGVPLPASGARVGLPLLIWEVRALCIDGSADAGAVEGLLLRDQGLRATEKNPANLTETARGSGRAHVQIWAPDYGGTTVGPIKAVYASVFVEPRPRCKRRHPNEATHMWWWWYYGNSVINQEFKQDVWGIPNALASVEILYDGPVKQVRLLEEGRPALGMRLDTAAIKETNKPARHHKPVKRENPPPIIFRTVARRTIDDGENGVEIHEQKPVYGRAFAEGDLYRGHGTAVDRELESVDFRPLFTTFYSGYNGVVGMYDEKGSAKSPMRHGGGRIRVRRLVKALQALAERSPRR